MILLHGTGTHNKGAELMALAVGQHYTGRNDVQLAIAVWFGPRQGRAKYIMRSPTLPSVVGAERGSHGSQHNMKVVVGRLNKLHDEI